MSNQIDDAVAAAEAAAANMTDQTPVVQSQGTSLAPVSNEPVDMSLAAFLTSGGITPDKWLQVKDTAMKIDKNEKKTIDEFSGELNFANVKMFTGLRISLPGNKYEYIKSYDGRTEARSGQNWNAAIAEANARSQKPSSTYRGADILVTLTEPVVQGDTTIAVGTKVGYTTSITGFAPFQSYLAELIEAGDVTIKPDGKSMTGIVGTVLTHETKKNTDYEWGVVNFSRL